MSESENLYSVESITATAGQFGSDKFAEEPQDFGQMHKVHTTNLEWCEADVRGLKRFAWRPPLVFSGASVAGSVAVAGLIEIVNFNGEGHGPTMNWVLFIGGASVAIVLGLVGIFALLDSYSVVDKAADRLKELRY